MFIYFKFYFKCGFFYRIYCKDYLFLIFFFKICYLVSTCVDYLFLIQIYFIFYYRLQIQRLVIVLLKFVFFSFMKKIYFIIFEFEKIEMEMLKLNQFDLDEFFKLVEMFKIK